MKNKSLTVEIDAKGPEAALEGHEEHVGNGGGLLLVVGGLEGGGGHGGGGLSAGARLTPQSRRLHEVSVALRRRRPRDGDARRGAVEQPQQRVRGVVPAGDLFHPGPVELDQLPAAAHDGEAQHRRRRRRHEHRADQEVAAGLHRGASFPSFLSGAARSTCCCSVWPARSLSRVLRSLLDARRRDCRPDHPPACIGPRTRTHRALAR